MKKLLSPSLALLMSLTLTACNTNNDTNGSTQQELSGDISQKEPSGYDRELVKFPENYDKGVNYTTVHRGNVREELYTSREAIEAVQNGQPFPDGTVITLEIYKDEELDEIFVMEKRTGWGDQTPQGTPRNGDWQYQEFNADRSLDYEEDIGRCFTCHANQERDEYVNTLDEMKSYDLENFTGAKESSTESQITGIPTDHWVVKEDSQDNLLGNSLMEDEEKAGIIQKVLLMIHFNKAT
ncbi:cytochrome P460 family protein [Metabacillus rhizolycopersici]|uniref:Cytochrome P460 family protein n=1 Tax=Metabacillus rhizolycopersici TaxID=2875709 RepID=A0ABS7UWQ0_9BACI|nr:cytochrome P460 family protein [Metabacillus rhizolycopersici]MBZ5752674.1 cytochrome P460 family protein [Metabacillus rhizolycopersici]